MIELKPSPCVVCDFQTGRRGMDRCRSCDGTGSVFWVGGCCYPNTEVGHQEAVEALEKHLATVKQTQSWVPTHRHVKTGGWYRVIRNVKREADWSDEVLYENEKGEWITRPVAEFYDGRFEVFSKGVQQNARSSTVEPSAHDGGVAGSNPVGRTIPSQTEGMPPIQALENCLDAHLETLTEPYKPGIVEFGDTGVSEFVLFDCAVIYRLKGDYQEIVDMETGEVIGFSWATKYPPKRKFSGEKG